MKKATLHRKDITADEFKCVGRFSYALSILMDQNRNPLFMQLGEVPMLLPVWQEANRYWLAGDAGKVTWEFTRHLVITQNAIGIDVKAFRRIANYLHVPAPRLIELLYRLSALALVPDYVDGNELEFIQEFSGKDPRNIFGGNVYGFGFVIEQRRGEYGFGKDSKVFKYAQP